MSLSPKSKPFESDDKPAVSQDATGQQTQYSVVKSAAKSDQGALNVTLGGGIRASSPAPSLISIDDSNNIRLGRQPDYLPVQYSHRHDSLSPAPRPRTLKGRISAFWKANKGLALVLISQLFGTGMNVTTRMLEVEGNNGKGYHPFQILFARMSITAIFATLFMWYKKTEHFPFGMREVRPLLVARGLSGFFGVFGMYYSLMYLPLADATVITFLAPSLACWACSYLIKEPFTRMEQIAAYISLFGVVLIARPVSLFTSLSNTQDPPPDSANADLLPAPTNATSPIASNYDSVTPAQRAGAVGVALLGVFGAAGAYTTIRWIGKRAHPLISVNYFSIWCTIVSVVMMLAIPEVGFLLPSGVRDWCFLVFLGICGFIMQFLLAAGLQYEKSSRATNMVYTQMLFALTFDKLVWGTTPGWLSIIGSSLILGSAIYVAMNKQDPSKTSQREERGNGEEERGLMVPDNNGDDDFHGDIQLRSMR
ncbi:hypothetical protein BU24DRAFT_440860 [Aaosphaeria arxii CBS 175.79]|uniref:EamA domain-containing protein n=1 Tax=Aaosphaeria arxii CBS 175.79 TaxID=1450172 RepID=A0A6A5XYX9_9PLEO|nr:uncharacterized protein BU24DRAFT_440860 [Aaosphaeria arxii CBS 175.79]KAF2018196.1 hypothetical protein BU24DRAFT_440860 [Aaosphaeria arxii CBS 175.79]